MAEQPEKSVSSTRRSLSLSFYTLLSRILGLLRDHFMAVSFGTGLVASAFSVAYRLPNMFRNLLAEGTLSQSFMPIFSEYESIGVEEARIMTGTVLSFLFFCLSIFVSIFFFFAKDFLPYLVGGTPEYGNLVVDLSLILFFLIMTASLSSIFMSISNSKHHYFVPSLSPIILNGAYIIVFIFIFPFYSDLNDRVFILASGIVVGGVLQLMVQALYVGKLGYWPLFRWNLKHPAITKIFRLMIPAAIGGSFYQLGLLVDIFLANYIQNQNPGLGAVVSLDYAQRLVQLPTGIIGVALATTILPSLLSTLRKNELEEVPNEITKVLSFGFFLTIPASIGLVLLGDSILNAIYFGGRWTLESTATAFWPLVFYSLAIPFYSANKVLISSYYAFKDTKTPLKIQMLSFCLSVVLSISFMGLFLHSSIALASAVSATSTFTFLSFHLKKHKARFLVLPLLKKMSRLLLPALSLSLWIIGVQFFGKASFFDLVSPILGFANASRLYLIIAILPAVGVYFLVGYALQIPEAEMFLGKILKRKRK